MSSAKVRKMVSRWMGGSLRKGPGRLCPMTPGVDRSPLNKDEVEEIPHSTLETSLSFSSLGDS